MNDLISDRVSFLICLINNFSVTCFCPILQKFNNGTGTTRFKYPLEVLFEILSFLTVDQLFKINSANWSLYRVSQLIYEPIRRPNPPRHLKRMRVVTYGRELQFICAEIVFEYTGQFQSKNEHKFKKGTFADNSYRRLLLIKEWDQRKCAWDCAYYRFCSNLFRPWDSIWGSLFNYIRIFVIFWQYIAQH